MSTAPRTPRQLADLTGITLRHACALVWQLRKLGQVEAIGEPRPGKENRYRLR